MEFSKEKMKQIRHLMILAAVLVLVIVYSSQVLGGIQFIFGIIKPFLYGGAIAFVLNILLRIFEEKVLGRWQGKAAGKVKRPLSIVLALLSVNLVIGLVAVAVIPQVTATVGELGKKLPAFAERVGNELEYLSETYPELEQQINSLEQIDINWESLFENVVDFLRNGSGDLLSSTVSVADRKSVV